MPWFFFAKHIYGGRLLVFSVQRKGNSYGSLYVSGTAPFIFAFNPVYCKTHIMSRIHSTA